MAPKRDYSNDKSKGDQLPQSWYLLIGVGQIEAACEYPKDQLPDSYLLKKLFAGSDCLQVARIFHEADSTGKYVILTDGELSGYFQSNKQNVEFGSPSIESVRNKLQEIKEKIGPNDRLIVYISCHGYLASNNALFLCMEDTKVLHTNGQESIDQHTALSSQDLLENLVGTGSNLSNLILFIDACHSGRILSDNINSASNKNIHIIASSGESSNSWNLMPLQQSIFTHYLVRGLKGLTLKDNANRISATSLYKYLEQEMHWHSNQLGWKDGIKQIPGYKSLNKDIEIIGTTSISRMPSRQALILAENLDLNQSRYRQVLEHCDFSHKEWDKNTKLNDCINSVISDLGNQPGTLLLYIQGILTENSVSIGNYTLQSQDLLNIFGKTIGLHLFIIFDCQKANLIQSVTPWEQRIGEELEASNHSLTVSTICVYKNSEIYKTSENFLESLYNIVNEPISEGLTSKKLLDKLSCSHRSLSQNPGIIEIVPRNSDEYFWKNLAKKKIDDHIKDATSNKLSKIVGFERNLTDIFVPLGLIENREVTPKDPKDPANGSEQGLSSRLNSFSEENKPEIKTLRTFEEDQFINQVIMKAGSGKRLVLIGDPGSGKTTYLQKIASQLTDTSDAILLWLDRKNFGATLKNNPSIKLKDYIFAPFENKPQNDTWLEGEDIPPRQLSVFVQLLEQGKVWLLIDGLDEYVDTVRLNEILQDLTCHPLTNANALLVCRANYWELNKRFDKFESFCTLPFKEAQVKKYIEKSFLDKVERGQQLDRELFQPENRSILDLVYNPLRLFMLCLLWWKEPPITKLPDSPAQLYKEFVTLYARWQELPELSTLNDRQRQGIQEKVNRRLGDLARAAMNRPPGERFLISKKDLKFDEPIIDPDLRKSDEFLIEMGWLVLCGISSSEPVYSFYHATFQEYFASVGLDDWDFFLPKQHVNMPVFVEDANGERVAARYRIFEPEWQGVMEFWIGGDQPDIVKVEFLKALLDFDDGIDFDFIDGIEFENSISH